jgi:DNA-binding PucR family transcriptional regulator
VPTNARGPTARLRGGLVDAKGNNLRALPADDLTTAIETIRAYADADLNVANAAKRMHVHPNTVHYRLEEIATKTGHDARTFTGLVDLVCILEITDNGQQP